MKKICLIILTILLIIGCSTSQNIEDNPSKIDNKEIINDPPKISNDIKPPTSKQTKNLPKPTIEDAFKELLQRMDMTSAILNMIQYRVMTRSVGNISIHTELYISRAKDKAILLEVYIKDGDPYNIVKKIGYNSQLMIILSNNFNIESSYNVAKYTHLYSFSTLPLYPIMWENNVWKDEYLETNRKFIVKENRGNILELHPVKIKEQSYDKKITVKTSNYN